MYGYSLPEVEFCPYTDGELEEDPCVRAHPCCDIHDGSEDERRDKLWNNSEEAERRDKSSCGVSAASGLKVVEEDCFLHGIECGQVEETHKCKSRGAFGNYSNTVLRASGPFREAKEEHKETDGEYWSLGPPGV